jgi:hypothetical protein
MQMPVVQLQQPPVQYIPAPTATPSPELTPEVKKDHAKKDKDRKTPQ